MTQISFDFDLEKAVVYRLSFKDSLGREVARVRLYLIRNDLHDRPYGYVEDLYVDPSQRGAGLGAQMMEQLIKLARTLGCYKVTAASKDARQAAQALYDKLGFARHGVEFRLDL